MPTVITKTVKSSLGDYSSVSAGEAGVQTLYSSNFVTADVQVDLECYNFSDTTAVIVDGTTTDATRYLRVVRGRQAIVTPAPGARAPIGSSSPPRSARRSR
jgi:hypothetical protein